LGSLAFFVDSRQPTCPKSKYQCAMGIGSQRFNASATVARRNPHRGMAEPVSITNLENGPPRLDGIQEYA
jgi:hypothetical protein